MTQVIDHTTQVILAGYDRKESWSLLEHGIMYYWNTLGIMCELFSVL